MKRKDKFTVVSIIVTIVCILVSIIFSFWFLIKYQFSGVQQNPVI